MGILSCSNQHAWFGSMFSKVAKWNCLKKKPHCTILTFTDMLYVNLISIHFYLWHICQVKNNAGEKKKIIFFVKPCCWLALNQSLMLNFLYISKFISVSFLFFMFYMEILTAQIIPSAWTTKCVKQKWCREEEKRKTDLIIICNYEWFWYYKWYTFYSLLSLVLLYSLKWWI